MSFSGLTPSQILQLERQGCTASSWASVRIHPDTCLEKIRLCRFKGNVNIGLIPDDNEHDNEHDCALFNALIQDCNIGDYPYIANVHGRLQGLEIGNNVVIENVGRITCEPEALCGMGVMVSVLDETGSHPVPLYPELNSQMASLMARNPRMAEHHLIPMIKDEHEFSPAGSFIGDHVRITDTGVIENVRIDEYVEIAGASRLINGRIINNSRPAHYCIAHVGQNVDAENFMIVDGRVDAGALIRNSFVGQGAIIDKYFTAHDSLFFANCSCECGEACAVLAGPYTVTMHKSSLLIGAEYSFMNAGSGTNSSNHMYKLGPVHWGTMQRGVKTSSGAYIMWNGTIGAFSLVMGQHKSHPDTSAFPFSYLFGSADGKTIVAPGLMLRSCGLARDKVKWPSRDRRKKAHIPLHDHINFEVLNPVTVSAMLRALPLLDKISLLTPEVDGYRRYEGMLFSQSSLPRAKEIYTRAIVKYLHEVIEAATDEIKATAAELEAPEEWTDLGSQILPTSIITEAREKESIAEIQESFDEAYENYKALEYRWVKSILTPEWMNRLRNAQSYIDLFNAEIEADRTRSLDALRN